MQFKQNINGLRAVAVIAVVLYHFSTTLLPGGFAGVDIFFVISGFLMTSIIMQGITKDNFSLAKFYSARTKRIIPPLIFLCIILLLFAFFFLSPLTYQAIGNEVAYAISFLSNIEFYRNAGYFDSIAQEKWLLHTWSLSVEWQFYLLYPLIILLFKKLSGIEKIKFYLLGLTLTSFLLNLYQSYNHPTAAFYLLPARAWEMTLGGLIYFYPWKLSNKHSKLLEICALILFSYAFINLNKADYWPGYLALIPVIGTVLFIQANRNDSWLINNRIMQFIGRSSYSIYLWHWPIVVYLYSNDLMTSNNIILGISLSFLLGFASYYSIEQKLKLPVKAILTTALCVAILGFGVNKTIGLYQLRLDEQQQSQFSKLLTAKDDWGYLGKKAANGLYTAKIESEGNKSTLFLGDSLIEHYYPKVLQLSTEQDIGSVTFLTRAGCIPISGMYRKGRLCGFENLLQQLEDTHYDQIVLGGNWFEYLSFSSKELYYVANDPAYYLIEHEGRHYSLAEEEGLQFAMQKIEDLITMLNAHTKKLYFLLPTPQGVMFSPSNADKDIWQKNILRQSFSVNHFKKKHQQFYTYMNKISDKYDIELIDPIDTLCSDHECKVMSNSQEFYYKDYIHLRPWYVIKYANYINDLFK
ncbi:acyltransferase family protein [Colwellia sp. RSH04]|uniref:acyltransferase family protein n=1 Tax=Colwellia sp. RSH04 TaxID=2305464 RepID=UPI000E57A2C9|nr:acyltransferase family protein [Colwellia sp. RSH04]RHW77664.1 acyltransferase [Colwellia sp. RSH04]